MKYQKIYNNLISHSKVRARLEDHIYEIHHIIPKCMGGSNDDNNLVYLTLREHFLAHKILTKIYPKNFKICMAFHRMTFSNNGTRSELVLSSNDYEYSRRLHMDNLRIWYDSLSVDERKKKYGSQGEKHPLFGKGHTLTSREKMSKNHANVSGENNPRAKTINIYDSNDNLIYSTFGNFKKICNDLNLPFRSLTLSYQKNRKLTNTIKQPEFIGWYAKIM